MLKVVATPKCPSPMIKLKSLLEAYILNPEEALSVGMITLYHGTTLQPALKAKKGELGPQNLKQIVVDVLVNEFDEDPQIAADYYEKYADYRKKDPKVLFLTPNFRTARNYAVSNTKWGGEVITDVLYRYSSEKFARRGHPEDARKWIEDNRTKEPAVVTITVPLSMVFTHPNWVTPARNRILNVIRNIKRQTTKTISKEELLEDLDMEVFVYENIPRKYVQRIDKV